MSFQWQHLLKLTKVELFMWRCPFYRDITSFQQKSARQPTAMAPLVLASPLRALAPVQVARSDAVPTRARFTGTSSQRGPPVVAAVAGFALSAARVETRKTKEATEAGLEAVLQLKYYEPRSPSGYLNISYFIHSRCR